MGSLENRLRKKWQDYSGKHAATAELSFYKVFEAIFEGSELVIEKQPKKFSKIYIDVELDKEELSEIYIPDKPVTKHGIIPDCLIRNNATGKEIYVEIKRQDGWVENKTRRAGRGNAHERLCKYFTPGLLRLLSNESKIKDSYPFWIVFQGDITRDVCRVKEIRFWFDGQKDNVTFWRDMNDPNPIIEHFINFILPMLQ